MATKVLTIRAMVGSAGTPTTISATKSITSATRSGTTLTVNITTHGYSNGNIVALSGFNEYEYNGIFIVANQSANAFDVTVQNNGQATTATGTGLANLQSAAPTAYDMRTAFECGIHGFAKNGSTGPGSAARLRVETSSDNLNWHQWSDTTWTTTNNVEHPFPPTVIPKGNLGYVRAYVYGNTNQSVTAVVEGFEVTSIG